MSIKKTVKDFKTYLDGIEEMSKGLDAEQKADLENILAVMLTLLVALKQSSNLGRMSINFLFGRDKK